MSKWTGKSKGNKTGYQLYLWLINTFGIKFGYMLLHVVVFYFFLTSFNSSKNLFNFYRKHLKYNSFKSLVFIYKNYYLLGQSIIDKIVVMSGMQNNLTFEFDGEDYLREIVAMKKGGILISAHLGSWDIAGFLLKRLGTSINIVIFDGEQLAIKKYLESIIERKHVKIIVIDKSLSHIYEINDALQRNELVCMHADRFIEGNKTILIDFLGSKARFPIGPFQLSKTFQAPVSYVFAAKDNDFHYHLYATPPVIYHKLTGEKLIEKIAQEFVINLEEMIFRYPTQWFNHYNFWN